MTIAFVRTPAFSDLNSFGLQADLSDKPDRQRSGKFPMVWSSHSPAFNKYLPRGAKRDETTDHVRPANVQPEDRPYNRENVGAW